jgi:uncharacterized protein YqeY
MRTVNEWKDLLRQELTRALRARDAVRTAALRETLTAIENAAAPPLENAPPARDDAPIAGSVGGLYAGEIARRLLTPTEARAVVVQAIADRRGGAAEFTRVARTDHAARLLDEAHVLEQLLLSDGVVVDDTASGNERSS